MLEAALDANCAGGGVVEGDHLPVEAVEGPQSEVAVLGELGEAQVAVVGAPSKAPTVEAWLAGVSELTHHMRGISSDTWRR